MLRLQLSQDLSTLDDQQRFDGLLEKVSLSALDPTDGLLDQSVDIIPGGTQLNVMRMETHGQLTLVVIV